MDAGRLRSRHTLICLAFDIGTHIGWVKGGPVGPLEHGVFDCLDTTDVGRWLKSADDCFRQVIPGATDVAFEMPYFDGQKGIAGVMKLASMSGHIAYWKAWLAPSAHMHPIMIQSAKATLAGDKWANKERMIAAAAERGYPDLNEHEADALGVWWCVVFGEATRPAPRRTRSSPGRSIGHG